MKWRRLKSYKKFKSITVLPGAKAPGVELSSTPQTTSPRREACVAPRKADHTGSPNPRREEEELKLTACAPWRRNQKQEQYRRTQEYDVISWVRKQNRKWSKHAPALRWIQVRNRHFLLCVHVACSCKKTLNEWRNAKNVRWTIHVTAGLITKLPHFWLQHWDRTMNGTANTKLHLISKTSVFGGVLVAWVHSRKTVASVYNGKMRLTNT